MRIQILFFKFIQHRAQLRNIITFEVTFHVSCEEESMQNINVLHLYLSDSSNDAKEQWTHSLTRWITGQDCCCFQFSVQVKCLTNF